MNTKEKAGTETGPMQRLLEMLSTLPGVNQQQALRIAAHLADEPKDAITQMASLLDDARKTGKCPECGGLTARAQEPCAICQDPGRVREALCVVEQPSDLATVERSGAHSGRYHVLDRLLNAKGDTDVEETGVPQLVQRVKDADGEIQEVIVATDPSPDGDYTAEYVAEALGRLPSAPRVTRPAMGIPSGSGPEFVDTTTVDRSVRDRRPA